MYKEDIENQLKIEEQPQHRIPGGQINETPGNLFDYENEYALAHWICANSRFDVGLSKFFQERYSVRDDIERNHILTWNGPPQPSKPPPYPSGSSHLSPRNSLSFFDVSKTSAKIKFSPQIGGTLPHILNVHGRNRP